MDNLVENNKEQFEKSIAFFQEDISSLRTGRISPSLVENIMVENYGVKSELLQLAAITSPEPQSITMG